MKIEEIVYNRGYSVSHEGILYNPKNKIIGFVSSNGYLISNVRVDGKRFKFSAHRLQAYQKYGNLIFNSKIVVRHLNGNPLDNSYKNILIGSHSDNMMDIPKKVRLQKSLYATSFIRKHDKTEVREFYNTCKSYKQTMEKFNISSKGTLHFILNK